MKLNLNLYKFQKKKLINFRLYRNFKKKFSNEEIYRVKNILLDININYEPLLYFKHLDINKSFVNNYLKQKLYKDLINKSEFEIDLIKFFLFKKKITVSLSNLHINYLRQNNIKVNITGRIDHGRDAIYGQWKDSLGFSGMFHMNK